MEYSKHTTGRFPLHAQTGNDTQWPYCMSSGSTVGQSLNDWNSKPRLVMWVDPYTLCRESYFPFPRNWGKNSTTNIGQNATYPFILRLWKHSRDGCVINNLLWPMQWYTGETFHAKFTSHAARSALGGTSQLLETGAQFILCRVVLVLAALLSQINP